jgi:hypothetical protein
MDAAGLAGLIVQIRTTEAYRKDGPDEPDGPQEAVLA